MSGIQSDLNFAYVGQFTRQDTASCLSYLRDVLQVKEKEIERSGWPGAAGGWEVLAERVLVSDTTASQDTRSVF